MKKIYLLLVIGSMMITNGISLHAEETISGTTTTTINAELSPVTENTPISAPIIPTSSETPALISTPTLLVTPTPDIAPTLNIAATDNVGTKNISIPTTNAIEIVSKNPVVQLQISIEDGGNPVTGDLIIELFPDKAPITVQNFLNYVQDGFYNNTIFHRVIKDFVLQGGGYEAGMRRKKTRTPITNEANNGLKNEVGTLSMARTQDINSATSQFFVNVHDNTTLNYQNGTSSGYGYAVFGKILEGMDLVEKIRNIRTVQVGYFQDVPEIDVVIKKAVILDQ